MRTIVLLMPLATTHPGHHTTLELLRAKAHIVPWLLLAGVVGLGLADLHRGSDIATATATAAPRAGPVEVAAGTPVPVSVHCNLRQGFVLRLIMNVQVLARTFVSPSHPVDPNAGARCLVHMERR
jgi:hypothetical protein